jgi:hypothetical protein
MLICIYIYIYILHIWYQMYMCVFQTVFDFYFWLSNTTYRVLWSQMTSCAPSLLCWVDRIVVLADCVCNTMQLIR